MPISFKWHLPNFFISIYFIKFHYKMLAWSWSRKSFVKSYLSINSQLASKGWTDRTASVSNTKTSLQGSGSACRIQRRNQILRTDEGLFIASFFALCKQESPSMHCSGGCTFLGGLYLSRGGIPAGGCTCPGGVPSQGVCLPGGVPARGCTCPGGVPAQGVCLPRVYLPGECTCPGGVYLPMYSPLPLWTEWLTDRCKNITFANFVCGR